MVPEQRRCAVYGEAAVYGLKLSCQETPNLSENHANRLLKGYAFKGIMTPPPGDNLANKSSVSASESQLMNMDVDGVKVN